MGTSAGAKNHRPIKKFAAIVSVNGVTKDLVRMLKVMSMATRDLKLGIVNSAFVKAYEQGQALADGTDPTLPYATHEGPLSTETQASKKATKNKKALDLYNRPSSREARQQARAQQQLALQQQTTTVEPISEEPFSPMEGENQYHRAGLRGEGV